MKIISVVEAMLLQSTLTNRENNYITFTTNKLCFHLQIENLT